MVGQPEPENEHKPQNPFPNFIKINSYRSNSAQNHYKLFHYWIRWSCSIEWREILNSQSFYIKKWYKTSSDKQSALLKTKQKVLINIMILMCFFALLWSSVEGVITEFNSALNYTGHETNLRQKAHRDSPAGLLQVALLTQSWESANWILKTTRIAWRKHPDKLKRVENWEETESQRKWISRENFSLFFWVWIKGISQ